MKQVKSKSAKEKTASELSREAGGFSTWLIATQQGAWQRSAGADVPCGTCTACCHSSLFIHIRPEEAETLKQIPKELVFPAPGLPKGHMLMGYDKEGRCPMFINNRCAIYAHRPQTCRDFDCRVFAATGIELNDKAQALIAETVKAWKFDLSNDQDRAKFSAVRAAAKFLQEKRDCLPEGARPRNPAQLAIVAIQVYHVFSALLEEVENGKKRPSDSEIAKSVLEALGPESSHARKS